MRWNPTDAERPQHHPSVMAEAVRLLRRRYARVATRPAGRREAANLLASFGMIGGLLLFWAMAVTL